MSSIFRGVAADRVHVLYPVSINKPLVVPLLVVIQTWLNSPVPHVPPKSHVHVEAPPTVLYVMQRLQHRWHMGVLEG